MRSIGASAKSNVTRRAEDTKRIEEEAPQFYALFKFIYIIISRYFFSFAVGLKMMLADQGIDCNADVNSLWEECQKQGIQNYEIYPEWLNDKMMSIATPYPNAS
jgi:hypothetical protein